MRIVKCLIALHALAIPSLVVSDVHLGPLTAFLIWVSSVCSVGGWWFLHRRELVW